MIIIFQQLQTVRLSFLFYEKIKHYYTTLEVRQGMTLKRMKHLNYFKTYIHIFVRSSDGQLLPGVSSGLAYKEK